jgi:glycosyltransferase involved in cell wall biosynthesis
MKVALVHDYLKEYGGAESVLYTFQQIWPQAPIYTLVYLPKYLGPHREKFNPRQIHSLIPSWIPFIDKLISPLRLLAPILFKNLDLTKYDLVIVSATGAYNPNLVKSRKGSHFCYCHTPPRFLYGLPTAREWQKYWWGRVPSQIVNHFLRMIDFRSAQKVDYFIANSKNTAARIWKFYRKKSSVIYPPVKLIPVSKITTKDNYFLAGGRLAKSKRIDLPVVACTKLNLPLKVFGRGFAGYGEELRKIAGPTVEFLGEVTDEEKTQLFAGCRALIFSAEEEDFGIMPVEAMMAGKPVIGLRQGGIKETIIEGKTGEFFDEPTVTSLMAVLRRFNPEKYKPADCLAQAQKFSKERFIKEIKDFVKKHD